MNNYDLKVGDTVNFIVGTSMLTGQIVKFYKGCFDEDECSVKTQWKTYAHIHLDRCEKVIDTTELQSQLNQQKAMWNELKEWLVDKMKYYNNCLNKNTLISSERQKILCTKSNQCFEIITQMEYIKKELEGEDE